MKWNLFLSWFAGTQASVIMISQNRQGERDRESLLKGIELDKKGIELDRQGINWLKKVHSEMSRMNHLMEKVSKLEEVISLIEEEEGKKYHDDEEN
jgi:uncharacterized membrane protein